MLTRLRAWAHALVLDVHATWLAARDPRTPFAAKALGVFVAGYALSPLDLIPDFVPVLGLLDDLLIVPAGIWLFVRMVPVEVMADSRAAAARADALPGGRTGAAVIAVIWLLLTIALAVQLTGFATW